MFECRATICINNSSIADLLLQLVIFYPAALAVVMIA